MMILSANEILLKSSPSESEQVQQPSEFLKTIVLSSGICKTKHIDRFAVTDNIDEWMENYDLEKVTAIRENNLEKLRSILNNGASFNACNRNHETLLHLACRRANMDVVRFLIDEAQVEIEVCDDLGRSVLHDICWRPLPDLKLMEFVMTKMSPALLLAEDRRGHTCFDYCRKQDWSKWTGFLREQEMSIQRRASLYSHVFHVSKD